MSKKNDCEDEVYLGLSTVVTPVSNSTPPAFNLLCYQHKSHPSIKGFTAKRGSLSAVEQIQTNDFRQHN